MSKPQKNSVAHHIYVLFTRLKLWLCALSSWDEKSPVVNDGSGLADLTVTPTVSWPTEQNIYSELI